MAPVTVVLAAVLVSCVVTVWVVHRILRKHREIIATLLARRALETKTSTDAAAEDIKGEMKRRLDNLAEATGSLAEAVRALLAARDPGGQKTPT